MILNCICGGTIELLIGCSAVLLIVGKKFISLVRPFFIKIKTIFNGKK